MSRFLDPFGSLSGSDEDRARRARIARRMQKINYECFVLPVFSSNDINSAHELFTALLAKAGRAGVNVLDMLEYTEFLLSEHQMARSVGAVELNICIASNVLFQELLNDGISWILQEGGP
ncbi:MAG: hypothetical protein A2751_02910 [Candidatus Doudnabacteria bacterium RIFCSPHIGHO2_01_FULL_46_14]|uniref:Uncharacterized protein n=1 Tax=Candidatus Doudnabacteria bacterium RIFCSPHIGHO2_01_FULL_46_14 TaxID=1817824 RepID=A0A1F5NJT5_9BACT|nr:MAG: hypothetical protein A2751_02910 [Candidatus Doudnabacteria bacterium RIFCSPHIGHO2_01_FULL_46_14]